MQETADFAYEAFDIADKYRTVVYILTDGMLAHMIEPVELKPFRDLDSLPEKPYCAHGKKPGQERKSIGWWLDPERGDEVIAREHENMYKEWQENEVRCEEFMLDDAEIVVAAWGTCARTAKTAIRKLRAEGVKVGLIRPITLHPFPKKVFASLDENRVKAVLVLENAIPAQFYYDVKLAMGGKKIELALFNHCNGIQVTQDDAERELRKLI